MHSLGHVGVQNIFVNWWNLNFHACAFDVIRCCMLCQANNNFSISVSLCSSLAAWLCYFHFMIYLQHCPLSFLFSLHDFLVVFISPHPVLLSWFLLLLCVSLFLFVSHFFFIVCHFLSPFSLIFLLLWMLWPYVFSYLSFFKHLFFFGLLLYCIVFLPLFLS